jgi:hypothetical protein
VRGSVGFCIRVGSGGFFLRNDRFFFSELGNNGSHSGGRSGCTSTSRISPIVRSGNGSEGFSNSTITKFTSFLSSS